MKVLKYVLGILAALAVIFVLIGVFVPTLNYSSEVEVNKSIEESFAVFMDESKMKDWLKGYIRSEVIKEEPAVVGSKYKVFLEDRGQKFHMIETVTAYKENEQFAMNLDHEMMNSDLNIQFEAKGDDKTVITATSEAKGKGILMKSMFVIMKSQFTKDDQGNYTRLKKVIEDNTTDYFPQAEVATDTTMTTEPI